MVSSHTERGSKEGLDVDIFLFDVDIVLSDSADDDDYVNEFGGRALDVDIFLSDSVDDDDYVSEFVGWAPRVSRVFTAGGVCASSSPTGWHLEDHSWCDVWLGGVAAAWRRRGSPCAC